LDQNSKMVSNARLVEWNDGTKTLVIGNQQYEVQNEPMNSTMCFAQYKKFSLLKGNVSHKMIVKPSLKSSHTHN